jgi:tetratricopeptide (TPR) repeat protein
MPYFKDMGNRLSRLSLCLAFGAQTLLFADEANWSHNMDLALQAAARQNYAQSEAAFVAAVRELELISPNDPRLGPTINSLGLVYRAENKLPQAEGAFRRAALFIEKANAPDSIDVANSNLNIGSILVSEGRYNLAEPFLQKAYRIYQKQLGDKSPKTAAVMAQMGEMYRNLHDNGQSELLLKRALDVQETARGIDDPNVANTVNSLAELYASQNQNEKAEPLFKLVMSIRESTAGMDTPEFAVAVERYAAILNKIGRSQDAERHMKLAVAVRSMVAKKTPVGIPIKSQEAVDMIVTPNPPATELPTKGNSFARLQ